MNYIVLDVEWNQGENRHEHGSHQVPSFEIIEIGALKLDEHLQIVDGYQSLIKPQIHASMNKITEELVHLNMDDIKDARPFAEVAEEFLKWCGQDYIFCIWGVQDLTEIQKNMDYYHMEPLSHGPIKYYDVQKLYSLAHGDGKLRASLSNIVEAENMVEESVPFHRAFGDAYYTALIFQKIAEPKLLERVSFDTYRIPEGKKEQILWKFDTYTKFISRGYEEKAELLADKNVSCVRCIYCEKALRKRVPWFTPNNGKHYYTIAKCPEHGLMKGKNRVRKNKEEKYFVIKTTRPVDEAEAEAIINRKRRNTEEM